MRFYNQAHAFYCGVDLHARTMYLCILNQAGTIVLHQDLPAEPASFLGAIAPYREGLVVACECLFCWYWLADLCQAENIAFVLGHALYMKAIHGGKSKDDKIDSKKIAQLLPPRPFPPLPPEWPSPPTAWLSLTALSLTVAVPPPAKLPPPVPSPPLAAEPPSPHQIQPNPGLEMHGQVTP